MSAEHKVVVSNGYGQFHLARLAENLERDNQLSLFLTGAYLSATRLKMARLIPRFKALTRFIERRIAVSDERVRSYWAGELPHQIAQRLRRGGLVKLAEGFVRSSLDGYARWAARGITAASANIYHYRAGMGGSSIAVARKRGMTLVCDHSIAHPRVLPGLVDGRGGQVQSLTALWERVERDLNESDGVIVNSDFVKLTCVQAGMEADRIHVAYTGVDPFYLAAMDAAPSASRFARVKVLFAGTLEQRKGADTVVDAVAKFSQQDLDWTIVGSWQPDSLSSKSRVPSWVSQIERLPRTALAAEMARSNVFVFPSRAEGSARVVAEALAGGCYVITTAESGSVVRDGVDGVIVRPGDAAAIESALLDYMKKSPAEREKLSMATTAYARDRLSESTYTNSVRQAYALIKPR